VLVLVLPPKLASFCRSASEEGGCGVLIGAAAAAGAGNTLVLVLPPTLASASAVVRRLSGAGSGARAGAKVLQGGVGATGPPGLRSGGRGSTEAEDGAEGLQGGVDDNEPAASAGAAGLTGLRRGSGGGAEAEDGAASGAGSASAWWQGLTLVDFSAQPKLFWSHLPVSPCLIDCGEIMRPTYPTECANVEQNSGLV